MNKVVHKYQILDQLPVQILSLPAGAVPLHLAFQFGFLCLWCLVDSDAPMQERTVYIYNTGHSINPSDVTYVGTVQEEEGVYVWHVFLRNL